MTVKRALLSVSNKAGLVEFARKLHALSVDLLASGGTARVLTEAGLPVIAVSDYTTAPEILGGRVKTLHPRIHGGILARRDLEDDQKDVEAQGIVPIDLVVVNLYPFEEAAQRGVDDAALIEEIDIGGPTLLRASAKNWNYVWVVCDPSDYNRVATLLESGEDSAAVRRELALKAFSRTMAYDQAIVSELSRRMGQASKFPELRVEVLQKAEELRYGENPHQAAALYRPLGSQQGLAGAKVLGGKALSFNNLNDAHGAWSFVHECAVTTACVVKHAAPCGAAQHENVAEAVEAAYQGDPLSAYGGLVAVNRPIDLAAARVITAKGRFFEVVIAPSFTEDALECLRKKKRLRILEVTHPTSLEARLTSKIIDGGVLVQDSDIPAPEDFKVVSKLEASPELLASLPFAVHCVKHVRSNAIVLLEGRQLIGVGGGQPSRVDAVHIAVRKAGERSKGSLLASDAFFPFPDGVEAASEAGVSVIVQPGGSKRDGAVTEAADRLGLIMIHSGRRHFLH